MLYEAVEGLFSKTGKIFCLGSGERMLRGLSGELEEVIPTLFEKRLNFSAKGIVIPDVTVKRGEIKLPPALILELFRPKILGQLIINDTITLRHAKKILERNFPSEKGLIRNAVNEAIKNHTILLITDQNYVGGFQPVLSENEEDEVIRLHPKDAKKLKIEFIAQKPVVIHLPLTEAAKQEVLNPQPRGWADSVMYSLNKEKIIKSVLAQEPVKLTELDKLALGFSDNQKEIAEKVGCHANAS
jgi:DNA-directed RNA polymerase subunit beta'